MGQRRLLRGGTCRTVDRAASMAARRPGLRLRLCVRVLDVLEGTRPVRSTDARGKRLRGPVEPPLRCLILWAITVTSWRGVLDSRRDGRAHPRREVGGAHGTGNHAGPSARRHPGALLLLVGCRYAANTLVGLPPRHRGGRAPPRPREETPRRRPSEPAAIDARLAVGVDPHVPDRLLPVRRAAPDYFADYRVRPTNGHHVGDLRAHEGARGASIGRANATLGSRAQMPIYGGNDFGRVKAGFDASAYCRLSSWARDASSTCTNRVQCIIHSPSSEHHHNGSC